MCWNKESSLTGFILNIIMLYYHNNSNSHKFIPLFITVALTQLFDFFVYLGYNKSYIGKLLAINLSLQILFLYKIFQINKIFYIVPLIFYLLNLNWKPYKNYNNNIITWNEIKYVKFILWTIWILFPLLYINFYKNTYNKNNNKNNLFIISASILLFFSEKFNFGSLGKNWCMTGVILNFITFYIYNN